MRKVEGQKPVERKGEEYQTPKRNLPHNKALELHAYLVIDAQCEHTDYVAVVG